MELCFINAQNRRIIKSLYPPNQFAVNVDIHNNKSTQNFVIIAEKLDEVLQIRLTDTTNQSRMFICTIDSVAFNQIRAEQSLQVQFNVFIDHLIKILDSCTRNELFLSLNQNGESYVLEFYEKRTFKNLIHLYLTLQEAPFQIVLFYLNQSLVMAQEQVQLLSNQNKNLQNDVNTRDFHIQEQQTENRRLNEKLAENENMILHRNTEEVKRLNQEIKNVESAKMFEENRLKAIISSFEAKVDQMNKDNYALNEKLSQEAKKIEALKAENNRYKSNITSLTSDNTRLQQNLSQYDASEKQYKLKIVSLTQQVSELSEKNAKLEKQKSDIFAEMEAERQICQTKKHALKIATDELAKNTETIRRQSKELENVQKKIDWRTVVLLRQEKEVSRLAIENQKFVNVMKLLEIDHDSYKGKYQEFNGTVQTLRKSLENLNDKYSKKISEIKDKVLQ